MAMSFEIFLKEKKPVLKRRVRACPPPPQNSAETLGFCRKVLWKVSHCKHLVEELSYRAPKVLHNFGSQAQSLRLFKFFSHVCSFWLFYCVLVLFVLYWKQAESAFGEHGFKHQAQFGPHRFLGRELTEFLSAFHCVSELTELVGELTELATKLSEFSSLKQALETVLHPFPIPPRAFLVSRASSQASGSTVISGSRFRVTCQLLATCRS